MDNLIHLAIQKHHYKDNNEADISWYMKNIGQRAKNEQVEEGLLLEIKNRYGYSLEDLKSPSRRQPLSRVRQIAMFMLRKYTTHSTLKIGEMFGGMHHATVIHACDKIKSIMEVDTEFKKEVEYFYGRF